MNINDYFEHHWQIIKLRQGEKIPLETGWQDHPVLSPLEINGSNVGIITGDKSQLVVVDIDDESKFNEYLQRYPTQAIVKSPKGYHLYYHYVGSDVRNSVSKIDDHVDVRANGGYIVAPPSKVGDKEYRWLKEGDPSPLPESLRELILTPKIITLETDVREDGHELYMRVLSNGFTSGKHNEELLFLARYLFRMSNNVQHVRSTLKFLNDRDPTPQSEQQLLATLRQAIQYETARKSKEPEQPTQVSFDVMSYMDAMAKYNTEEVWLVDNLILKPSVTMIAAMPEQYKTWLSFEIGVAVAAGNKSKSVLQMFEPPDKGSPVLFVQQEDYMGRVIERVNTIAFSLIDKSQDTLDKKTDGYHIYQSWLDLPIFFHTESNLAFDNPDSIMGLEQKIKEHNIQLVIIDPIYKLDTDENYYQGLARKLTPFHRMRNELGVSFILVHHLKKSGGEGRSRIYGSTLLSGAVEAVLLIEEPREGEPRKLYRYGKTFPGAQTPYQIEFDIKTYDLPSYESKASPLADQAMGDKDKIMSLFTPSNEVSTAQILNAVGKTKQAVNEAINRLVNASIIERASRGKYRMKQNF